MSPSRKDAVKRPTIADVARLAGVGTMTVSRAINGHPYVSDLVAKKVQNAIRQLDYTPNAAAQMLNGRPSATIGLIVPDLADSFFALLTHAVQATAREHKYQVWIAASNSDAKVERLEAEQMVRRAVDGILIVACRPNNAYFKKVVSAGVPMVSIDRPLEGVTTDSVEVENYKGSREAVEHLIAHGRKRILCVGYNAQQSTIAQRVLGYRDAVNAAGLPVLTEVSSGSEFSASLRIDEGLLKKIKPDGVFALNNVSTFRCLEIFHEQKTLVPAQIALIGFDDVDAWRVTNPSITVVRQPVEEMGSLAVKILMDRTRSAGRSITRTILPTRLVVRSSCGCPPTAHVHLPARVR